MQQLADILLNTITLGCTYGLIGMGFVVVFRSTQVISFAQGAFMMIGALLFATLINASLPVWLAFITTVVALAVLGSATFVLVFGRLAGLEPFVAAMATVGVGTLIEAAALLIWGPSIITMRSIFATGNHHLGGAFVITDIGIFTLVVTVVVFLATIAGLQLSPLGLRMRASADNPTLASYTGLGVARLSSAAWALAAATAALAGIIFLIGTQPDPATVYSLGLGAFPAILLGGIDSIGGCLVGGIIIAFAQSAVVTWWGGQYQDVVAYALLLLLLLVRPQGLFGRVDARRL
jgi:branched-chain amino acid transport system permease protein